MDADKIEINDRLPKLYQGASENASNNNALKMVPNEEFRRSLSVDPSVLQEDRTRYPSTDSAVSTSISGSKDRLSTSALGGVLTGSGAASSKFGGSTFSITKHKKIDLSAYDQGTDEKQKSENDKKLTPQFESYNVLEKAAAIALEQVQS